MTKHARRFVNPLEILEPIMSELLDHYGEDNKSNFQDFPQVQTSHEIQNRSHLHLRFGEHSRHFLGNLLTGIIHPNHRYQTPNQLQRLLLDILRDWKHQKAPN